MANKAYTASSIQEFSGIDWILKRPENHIQVTNRYGQFHIIREVLDNATDETEQITSPGNLVTIYMFLDKENNTYQTAIRDTGRGIPHEMLVPICTKAFVSGKYDDSPDAAYQATGGLNGIGLKVAMALSENFKAIVRRDNKISSVYVHRTDLEHVVHKEVLVPTPNTGTLVVLEPKKNTFTEIDLFIDSGYEQITKLCYLISLFSRKTTIIFKIVHHGIDPRFWTMGPKEADMFIEKTYDKEAEVVADGTNMDVAMLYLKELWGMGPEDTFQWSFENIIHEFNPELGSIGYSISMFLPKIKRNTCATTMVNNIPIHDANSSHVTVIVDTIKNKIAPFIVNPDHQEYFLTIYKLPICVAIAIKYTKVKFTGLSKSGFRDPEFEQEYTPLIKQEINAIPDEEWKQFYEFIASDIETKYLVYYNKPLSSKKSRRDSVDIVKPIYVDCNTRNRQNAELYIVEGLSASHITECRNHINQAVLMIYGKPKNVFKTGNLTITPQQIFNQYEIYQDLEKILHIHPKQEDLSTANFGKIILINDADIDGGHIRALHIGGLYALNPRIIEQGMVYLANPPLYEVTLDNSDKPKTKFIQDKPSLIRFFIECLYKNALSISIMDGQSFKEPTQLDDESYVDFCYIITELGELFEHLSSRLAIPLLVLEKLTHLTHLLTPGKINSTALVAQLGRGVSYNPKTDILTVIGSRWDASFALNGVRDALYEELLGYLHKLCWKQLQIFVSTKYTNTLQNSRVSITQLYEIFKTLNSQVNVLRQKGLGGIDANDLEPLCMNPETRVLHQITSIGDFIRIQQLLGDDVTARRAILANHGLEI